tara:strand:- start:126 stop:971 length:846 start_codon:yes stop_codon:yes gene_type:complete
MYSIIHAECQETLSTIAENSFHACITDPPYGMGMDVWDHSVPTVDIWKEVYRVLRPGAFCLSFCSPELYHRMAVAVEDAGFTIKDQIMWMTTTKMPKYNRLKPAHEPIVVAQKPVEGTIKSNHEKWGCGLIDTDNTRIPWDKKPPTGWIKGGAKRRAFGKKVEKAKDYKIKELGGANPVGRYPSNIIGEVLPSHQKYFYAPRASRKEKGDYNDHPTVKPISLMSYLVRIYAPQNSTVLDPFCGSGTTAVSSILEKRNFVGIEMSKEYVEISKKRCESILIP